MKRLVYWSLGSLTLIFAVSVGVAVWGWYSLQSPIGGSSDLISVKVVEGQNTRDISESLASQGIIHSSFWLLAYLKVSPHSFLPGIYSLSRAGSSLTNVAPLFSGKVAEKQVTIPEGLRANEIGQLLQDKGILKAADFLAAATYDPKIASLPASYNLKNGTFIEGFLFPDTYRFLADATPAQVIERMLKNYRDRTEGIAVEYDTLILASIVEREAKFDEDRPQIAGLYTNRLAINMALQSDPTAQYAKANAACGGKPLAGCTATDWWPLVVPADLQSDSPYNTYQGTGLPPGPITNPGLESIEAAANPAKNDYLYFMTDAQGHAHFAKTLTQHNQNVAKYLIE